MLNNNALSSSTIIMYHIYLYIMPCFAIQHTLTILSSIQIDYSTWPIRLHRAGPAESSWVSQNDDPAVLGRCPASWVKQAPRQLSEMAWHCQGPSCRPLNFERQGENQDLRIILKYPYRSRQVLNGKLATRPTNKISCLGSRRPRPARASQ